MTYLLFELRLTELSRVQERLDSSYIHTCNTFGKGERAMAVRDGGGIDPWWWAEGVCKILEG
jgi:hypothetical protein